MPDCIVFYCFNCLTLTRGIKVSSLMWEVVNATGHWSDKKITQQEPTVDHWCGWSMAWSWFWVTADGWLTADFQTDLTTMELSLNCVFTQPWKILTPQKGLTHFLGIRSEIDVFQNQTLLLISVFNKPTTFQSNLATLTWSPHDSLPWSLPVKSQSSVSRHFWLKSLTSKTVSLETSLVPKTSAAAACARWQLGAPHGSLVGPWLCFPHQLPALRLPATHRPHHCIGTQGKILNLWDELTKSKVWKFYITLHLSVFCILGF